jgi:23S rRNA (cytosine1962-C5)-methyltransferase
MNRIQKLPIGSENWRKPWVQMRTWSFSPTIYPGMLGSASPDAKAGDFVHVYDKNGDLFGAGFYCPGARVPLRVVHHGAQPVGEDYFTAALERALDWRQKTLNLDAQTDAYRVVNSDGDSISGLIVDRYADVLSVTSSNIGVTQRLPAWLPLLHARLGTKREVIEVEDRPPAAGLRPVRVREHGVKYEVDFAKGHKTGFFCDQRENRRRFAELATGKRVLDLCCYTGGFAVAAAVLGEPTEVTGVDLDEDAIAQARRNGNLNQRERIKWVHADAFAYARQMRLNGQLWGAVVADPPKFLESREDEEEGRQKYEDINRLAIALVEPGGLLVTCSCSGRWSMDDFERAVVMAVHKQHRRLQFFDRTGPGADHPVMSNAMEGRYLKVLWARVY